MMDENEPTVEELAKQLTDEEIQAVKREEIRRQEWICTDCGLVLDGLEYEAAEECPKCGKEHTYMEIRRDRT